MIAACTERFDRKRKYRVRLANGQRFAVQTLTCFLPLKEGNTLRKSIFALSAVLAVALLGITGQAHAGIDVGLEYAIPTGGFSDIAGGGPGLSVQYTTPKDNIEIGGSVGFLALGGQKFVGFGDLAGFEIETAYTAVPIGGLGRYFFNGVEEGGIFVGAKIGLAFVSRTIKLTAFGESVETDESVSGYRLAPKVGFRTGQFQVDVSYDLTGVSVANEAKGGTADIAWLGIEVAYSF